MSKDTVKITEPALNNMINYMRELIYTYKDEEADSATHPLEIGFLDYLISVRTELMMKKRQGEK